MTTLEIVHRDPSSYTCTLERVQHRFTRITGGFSSLLYAKRLLRLALWPVEERRYRCDLIEVFKMFYGYTEIDKRVLFTLDGNDKGLCGHSKKICKKDLTRILGNIFSQIESLTDGTVWTRTLYICTQPELFQK